MEVVLTQTVGSILNHSKLVILCYKDLFPLNARTYSIPIPST